MPWQSLVKTALLGTGHSTLPDETLHDLQAQGIDVSQEAPLVLLQGAALYGQLRKAGFRLENYSGELPKAAEAPSEKDCSIASAHHFYLILSGQYEAVLPEFIFHLLKNGKCLPAEQLPQLLRRTDTRLFWEDIQPTLGSAGRWLLAQHPAWRKLLADYSQTDWHTGSRQERLALLRFLRKNNPSDALQTLQSTWAEEDPSDRVAFLGEMGTGLSAQDEPFLENCLDEKRKEVRQAAAKWLAKLPGSRLSGRMYQRTMDIFEWKQGKLSIHLPEEISTADARDGILKINTAWKGGTKAAYLGQLVAAIDPKNWEHFFGKKPLEILSIFARSDWASTLLKASAEAALFHQNQSWIAEIGSYWMEYGTSPHWDFSEMDVLLANVPPAVFNPLALDFLKKTNHLPEQGSAVFKLLQKNQSHFDDELSNLLISRFKNWLSSAKRQDWESFHYKAFLKMVALRSAPELLEGFQKGWNTESPLWAFWEKPVEDMLNTLLFRKEMIAELSKA
jgi:hypothetical protein